MELIEGLTRDYPWGSTTVIPELLGLPPTGAPVAELWLGAHPSAPALVGAGQIPLDRLVAQDPEAALGPAVNKQFGSLPFLLKVLAAAEPLSLQAHPSTEQAVAGFAREDAAGIALDAPERSFRDRRHKPELICALTEFEALCGFREAEATLAGLATIDTAALEPATSTLQRDPNADGIAALLEWALSLDKEAAAALVAPVVAACAADGPAEFQAERTMAAALGARYRGDVGVVIALLLNLVVLEPGEALFLGAGNLHAYLRGTGVEIMASSDNVVRGGLTTKHVDVASLIEIIDAEPLIPEIQRPEVVGGVARYEAPVADFLLDRIELAGTHRLDPGPALVLCTAGSASAGDLVLDRGAAVWIPASDADITLSGTATLFRATAGHLGAR